MGQILGEKVVYRCMHAKHNLSIFPTFAPVFFSPSLSPFKMLCLMFGIFLFSKEPDQPLDQWPQVLTLEHIINQMTISSASGPGCIKINHVNIGICLVLPLKPSENQKDLTFHQICTLLLLPNGLARALANIKWTVRNCFYRNGE